MEQVGQHPQGAEQFLDADQEHQQPRKTTLHPDFGGNGAYGIPSKIVPSTDPKRTIRYTAYGDESSPCRKGRAASTNSAGRFGAAIGETPTSA